MFFKRLLIAWFLLFTLNSSVAWAFSDNSTGGHHSVSQADDSGDGQPLPLQQNDTCYDHCGHSGAHVVALIPNPTVFEPETESAVSHFCKRIADSRKSAPPLQPPIS